MSDWKDALAARVREQGAASVARDLGVPRSAVVAVLAGTARDGTELHVYTNFQGARPPSNPPPRAA
jgi:hypothetical protein